MLQIRLLGQFDVRLNGKRVEISSRAGQSLLAYLALTAGTSHRREKLAGTIWPDISEEHARRNLRQELWRIRKAIPNQGLAPAQDYLLANELTLSFNRHADYWLDVAILERPDLDPESLTSSLSLYQGELLPGFYDDWIVLERERIQIIFESKMNQLVEKLVELERWTAVQEQCERWLALGSASEPAYRALMLAYSARGDMAKVSTTYQRCMENLRDQFGVEPSAETHALYNGLLKGARAPRRIVPAQPSGTVTFLFTDIQGSTRLLDKLGEQYASALAEHHQILRAAIQKWNGSEMDTQGDAFFVTFARAIDAVQCAVEAQRMLSAQTWPLDAAVRVRMGLHTGEPLIASTGYVGMDVHRAARIGDAGHGGQVLLSQTTRELVLHDLPKGITIRDLGEHRLKDMKYPTPIYQLVIEGLQAEFPPLKTKFTGAEAPTPGEPPFKGLQYFEEQDADLFFGRELLTAKLVKRLSDGQCLSVIVGASGSGKSSLVRAGLIPALKKGRELIDGTRPPPGSADWQIYVITPTMHPLEALASELTRTSESVTATATLLDDLTRDPRSLSLFLARSKSKRHTLLGIDQFEELFTLCHDEFEREAFIDNLLSAASPEAGRMTLVITLRADFYAHLSQYPELRAAVAQQQEYIGPMTMQELRRAIEEPARRGHWEFEPGLVDLILRDVGEEPGALPLLSHALLETWQRRAGHTLTLKGYADAGGVHGAIAHTAETVYQSLTFEEQSIARNIFLRLTELGEGTEDMRRRASFEELVSSSEKPDRIRSVLNKLADARLITLSENTAEVAHEALIREWPTLREWLNEDREGLRLQHHLTEAAYEWELLGRDAGALYRGAHLAQAREWAAIHPNALNAVESAFLTASVNQEQESEQERQEQQRRELEAAQKLADSERARAEEQTRSANRLRIRNRVVTTVGTIALVLALLAGIFGIQSSQNALLATTNLGIADQQRAAAINAQATAQAETLNRATQQALAEASFTRAEAQRLAAEANNLYQKGSNVELIALLSIRSLLTQYTPQGDVALLQAATLDYPRQLFRGHTQRVWDVVFSPDGRFLLTASDDRTARLWNVQTGQTVRALSGHTGPVLAVAFSPDGQFMLTGSADKTARLWATRRGQPTQLFRGHEGQVSGVAFSSDGQFVLTGSFDNTARLWDVSTGQTVQTFVGHTDSVTSVALSPDGQDVLTGSLDGTARLWKIETGKEIRSFSGHSGAVRSVAFSPDGRYVLTGSADTTAILWNTAAGQEVRRFVGHEEEIVKVAYAPDGKSILTSGSDDNTARLWDVETGNELHRFTGHINYVTGVAFSPDGSSIATSSYDATALIWSSQAHVEPPIMIGHTDSLHQVVFSPDGKYLLTGAFDHTARLWDVSSGALIRIFSGHTDSVHGVAYSADGKYIATASFDKTARLWDITTGKEIRQFIGHTARVDGVVFSPDGRFLLTSSESPDLTARLWDVETGKQVLVLAAHTDRVHSVAISPDGKYLLTGSEDGTTRLWDAANGDLLKIFYIPGGAVSVEFSPDGKYILTGSFDPVARLWDVQTGDLVQEFVGHSDAVRSAVFSADGKFVLTASTDKTARLWDAQTGEEVRRFAGHTQVVNWVAYSPDGRLIATASSDGTARLWHVDVHETIEHLCSLLPRDFKADERAQYDIQDDAPTCP